jgi:pimeloyl-ACP methyl ester carboxylesterase
MAWAVLYLHGVGTQVRDDRWYEALAASLDRHGIEIPKLQSKRVIRPDYAEILQFPPEGGRWPARTSDEPGSDGEKQARRAAYARAQNSAVSDLPHTTESEGMRGAAEGLDFAQLPMPRDLVDARTYLRSESVRKAILHRVITEIGKERDLVIIGHSLGSVVGIDLLAHLPANVRVRRFVTIGSPAGLLGLWKHHPEALLRKFPYHQVEGWVNVLSPWDVVTQGVGLASIFGQAVDVRIPLPVTAHAASQYLAHPAVAKAVAEPLLPKRRAESMAKGIDVPAAPDEADAIDGVLFARMLVPHAKNASARARYEAAVQAVATQVGSELVRTRTARGEPVPQDLVELASGNLRQLKLSARTREAELFFTCVATTNNPIAPYEMDVEKEQLLAVPDLWHEGFGYPTSEAAKVAAAIRSARRAFGSSDWQKYALGAAGLALLAAGPIGLIIAAPAGLAGGAAITASLAAFGPGGMVGGMAMAGGLVGLGSGAVARSSAFPSAMSPDMLQTQCVRLMAFARLHKELDLVGDRRAPWLSLVHWHGELANELNRLSVFSDKDSHSLKILRRKLKILDTAIEWMVDQGLAPQLPTAG